ncbi:MAG TPA: ATP-binding cassette domain-containing protein [Bryobacteraceae bacterium]|jgi:osmoprotectant transport system ATP-binding protein|nr:ATP-binding cassette domain-containing protein [Bryobacteraceae bacterium]
MPERPFLSFANVSYHAGEHLILDRVSFDVFRGETLVLLGRSGSGKTTALRLINRMLEPSAGTIAIDGKNIAESNVIDLRRRIGYVIQEFGLLPHWTVLENAALVPRLLSWPPERQAKRAEELLEKVALREFSGRYPNELSGGQRQRVAVARALAAEPLVLLFDEPFGALDPITRHEMQQLFLSVREQYQGASVFVTHDVLEALVLATRIAVLENGKLEGIFTPHEFVQAQTPVARAFLSTLPSNLKPGPSANG